MRDLGSAVVARHLQARFPDGANVIVDGLRTPDEVEHLRSVWPAVRVLHVQASARLRYERSVLRARDLQLLDRTAWLEEDRLQASMGLTDEVIDSISDWTIHNEASLGDLDLALAEVAKAWASE
jgi:hypothetical protein